MDEPRKRVLGIMAAIIASRRLAQLEFKPCPAFEATIANAIHAAERIMKKIDSNFSDRARDRDF
jgi:hypothetical protein